MTKLENIDVGFGAKAAFKHTKNLDAQRFRLDCKICLMELYNKLIEKSPFNKRVVLCVTCLNLTIMQRSTLSMTRIKVAVKEFVSHKQISTAEGDIIMRESIKVL